MLHPVDVTTGVQRLGRAMAARRRELSLSATAAAELAGIHRATWATAESGSRTPHPHNRAGIERALQWAPGSVDELLAGGDARAVAVEGSTPDLVSVDDEELRAWVARIESLPYSATARLDLLRAFIELHGQAAAEAPPKPKRNR